MLQYWKIAIIQIIFISNFCYEAKTLEFSNFFDIFGFNKNKSTENDKNKDVLEDSSLQTCELVKKYKYDCEKYTVETEDGYLLQMHRMPKAGAQPVLLMHGLMDASSTWVLMGPGKGLAYLLSDLGYDVWMGNVRGNTYSKNHKNLFTNSEKFWNFTFDEMGNYDMPAMIDYVLKETPEFKKIHYIGHSQGSLVFFVLNHYHPEYNQKILSMQGLAPASFLSHCKSLIVRGLTPIRDSLQSLASFFVVHEFMSNSGLIKQISRQFCKNVGLKSLLCGNILFGFGGYDEAKINKTKLPIIGSHVPAGASVRQIIHFLQLVESGHFRNFDYGIDGNLKKYGQEQPPNYDLSKVTSKVAIHYAENDLLVRPEDVEILISKLTNVIHSHLVADKNYNHLNFLWAIDAKEMVYDKVFDIMHKVEKGEL